MMKNILKLTIGVWLVCQAGAATRADVVPITWNRPLSALPPSSFLMKTVQLHRTSLRYILNYELDSLQTAVDSCFNFNRFSIEEYNIRPSAHEAWSLAIALVTGTYDSAAIGRDTTAAWQMLAKLIKSLGVRHKSNGSSGTWGYAWQSALWTHNIGMAAWMAWDRLDTVAQNRVANMVAAEANRFNNDPPYCYDCTNDTKAEENAWNANVLCLAASMMPGHVNVQWWRERASQWMLSAWARESDLKSGRFVDGKPVNEWITGWNIREDGYLYNHNRMHPDYMTAAIQQFWSAVPIALSGSVIPQAALWNMDVIYHCLTDFNWPYPPYLSPGGTIYRPDSARVYFPEGTDWSANRVDNYLSFDVFAGDFGFDSLSSRPASNWYLIRADHLLAMQARSSTGQLYVAGELDFQPKEGYASLNFGLLYFSTLLKAAGYYRSGNWRSGLQDSTPPSIPAGLSASAASLVQTALVWHPSLDAESGIEGYYIYRDDTLIYSTRDTFALDEAVDYRLVSGYRYRVSAVNHAGLEGAKCAELEVVSPGDTTLFRTVHVWAVNDSLIQVLFSRPVDSVSAVATGNYVISGLGVSCVALWSGKDGVTLTVSGMEKDATYHLNITGIRDLAEPAHELVESVDFKYDSVNNRLKGYWPMDEEMGRTIYELSGGNNDGVCQNSYSRIPGKINNGLHFVPNGYVLMKNNLSSLSFPFTLALWINREDDSARALLCTEDVSGEYYGAWMGVNGSGQVSVNFGNGGSPNPGSRKTKASNSIVPKNVWTHVAAVVNSATDMTLYINGMDGEGTYSGTATSMTHSTISKMQIGYQTSAITPIQHYHGGMDDIRVYDTALTQEQISRLAAEPSVATAGKTPAHRMFSLDAAPNPFNPTVAIHFSLPAAQKVVLDVFDVRGGLVARLLDGQKDAGEHKVVWSGARQASGVYLLRLQAGTKVLERKLVYLK
ncbi:MAG: LamG-like jellyroll fold domain-containing protein [Fibrobacterota bacterium]